MWEGGGGGGQSNWNGVAGGGASKVPFPPLKRGRFQSELIVKLVQLTPCFL